MGHKHNFASLAWIAVVGLAISVHALSARSDLPEGFTRIFDGRTTRGWHFSGTVHHGTTGVATVTRDGVLQLTQKPFGQGGLFLTDKVYTNFELYLEVKVPFATNSGIFLRSTEGGSAYQIELVQGGGTGALFGELLRISEAIPAPDLTGIWKFDEFNSIRVRMDGEAPHITIWINGVKTGEVQEPRNDQIGGVVGGHIGLQLHWQDTYEPRSISGGGMSNAMKPGHPLEFRNIGIRELPAAPSGIGMTFIRIEPGTMQVGVFHPDCDNGGRGEASRDPRMAWNDADRAACEAQTKADRSDGYPVTIAKPYLIGKTEVTQGQWKAVMGSNPSLFQGDKVTNPDNHPVERVSWQDAQAFVTALNAMEKTTAYRLPTEFEWEYACRAGGPGQQTWTDIRAQAVLGLGLTGRGGGDPTRSETPAQYTARTGMTNEVGVKAANAWGVHDMLGNVWEWVADPYNGKMFPDPASPKSGSPRTGSGQAVHVLKGGGFASDVKNAICATHGFGPGDGFAVGFRIVKDLTDEQSAASPAAPIDAVGEARGRLFFAQTCSFCHGIDARGGAEGGPDLTQSPIVRDDPAGAQLGRFLQVGRPDKKMPAFSLPAGVLADVAMFLRTAVAAGGSGVSAVVVGDAKAGQAFFNGDGNCTKCHSVTGDLKGIGLKYPTATLQGKIVLPRGGGGYPGRGSEIAPFRSVTVTLPSGERHTGTLVAVSLFAVTLQDAAGVRRTFTRDADVPRVDITDPLQAHLDLMATMTDTVMHDLTAYLVTLR